MFAMKLTVMAEINIDKLEFIDSDDDLIRIPMFNLHNKIKILIEDALPALR